MMPLMPATAMSVATSATLRFKSRRASEESGRIERKPGEPKLKAASTIASLGDEFEALDPKALMQAIDKKLQSQKPEMQIRGVRALILACQSGLELGVSPPDLATRIETLLDNEDWGVQGAAAEAVRLLPMPLRGLSIIKITGQVLPEMRLKGIAAINKPMPDELILGLLDPYLKDQANAVRKAAVQKLAVLDDDWLKLESLLHMLIREKNPRVEFIRGAALEVAPTISDKAFRQSLYEVLTHDTSFKVSSAAQSALRGLLPKKSGG